MHRWFTEELNTTQDEEQEGKVRLKMKGCFFLSIFTKYLERGDRQGGAT